jgi:hypothetical protein
MAVTTAAVEKMAARNWMGRAILNRTSLGMFKVRSFVG